MVKTGWLGDQKPLETTFKLFLRFIFIEYFYVNFYSFFPVMMSFFLCFEVQERFHKGQSLLLLFK